MRKATPAWQLGPSRSGTKCCQHAFSLIIAMSGGRLPGTGGRRGRELNLPGEAAVPPGRGPAAMDRDTLTGDSRPIARFEGLPVRSISFEGVAEERLKPLSDNLAQGVGAPLIARKLRGSLHRLFATGLFETIEADGTRKDDGVELVFRGKPEHIHRHGQRGRRQGRNDQHAIGTAGRLTAGTRFSQERLDQAVGTDAPDACR